MIIISKIIFALVKNSCIHFKISDWKAVKSFFNSILSNNFIPCLQDSKQTTKLHSSTKHRDSHSSSIKTEDSKAAKSLSQNYTAKTSSRDPVVNEASTSGSHFSLAASNCDETKHLHHHTQEEERWMDNSSEVVSDDSDIEESDIEVV